MFTVDARGKGIVMNFALLGLPMRRDLSFASRLPVDQPKSCGPSFAGWPSNRATRTGDTRFGID